MVLHFFYVYNHNYIMKPHDFTHKREQMAVNIRQNNREEFFSKRRNFSPFDDQAMMEEGSGENKKNSYSFIVEERFRKQIEMFSTYPYKFEDAETLLMFINMIDSEDIIKQHEALIGLRRTLTTLHVPPIEEVIQANILEKLFAYLKQKQYPQLKLEAAWIVTNLAAGKPEHCKIIVEKGVINIMLQLLKENESGIIDQVIWAIGNISVDEVEYRNQVINEGGLQLLANVVLSSNKKIIKKNGCWAISNLCRGSPKPPIEIIKTGFKTIAVVLGSQFIEDKEILSDCLWVLSHGTQQSVQLIGFLMETKGIFQFIFSTLRNPYLGILIPALQLVGNLSTADQIHTDILINYNFLQTAMELLDHPKQSIRRQAAWILSNIAAGSERQVNFFMQKSEVIEKIYERFLSDTNIVKRELCWVFANFGFCGNKETVLEFYERINLLPPYENYFQVGSVNKDYYELLGAINRILKTGRECQKNEENIMVKKILQSSIPKYLEHLQLSKEKDVSERAVKIIKKYFIYEES